MEFTEEIIQRAISIAKNTRKHALSFRSHHPIGACIITSENRLYGGCNTESDISGLGVCAERSAADHAVLNGQYEYKGLVVYDEEITYPCGTCLQYLELFSQITGEDIVIILANEAGIYQKDTLSELLPQGYKTHHHLDEIKTFKNKPISETKQD